MLGCAAPVSLTLCIFKLRHWGALVRRCAMPVQFNASSVWHSFAVWWYRRFLL